MGLFPAGGIAASGAYFQDGGLGVIAGRAHFLPILYALHFADKDSFSRQAFHPDLILAMLQVVPEGRFFVFPLHPEGGFLPVGGEGMTCDD